ncbi:MAG: hypothetical protein LBC56_08305 [Oscillospiraceae bacterium]|jgi:rod shape-determining protein MreD|nr:hypothetical protein [Oscillospiraceae bacterium]
MGNEGFGGWSSGKTTKDKNSLTKRRLIAVLKWLVYSIIMILSYVLMVTPGFLTGGYSRPMLLIPLTVCISMFEGEFAGGLFAAAAGIFWDTGSDAFMGFHALILFVCCIGCGLLIQLLLKKRMLSAFLLCAAVSVIYSGLYFFFYFGIWPHSGAVLARLFLWDFVPIIIYTFLCTPLYFYLVRFIYRKIRPRSDESPWEN